MNLFTDESSFRPSSILKGLSGIGHKNMKNITGEFNVENNDLSMILLYSCYGPETIQ